jgi:hypothetical protein
MQPKSDIDGLLTYVNHALVIVRTMEMPEANASEIRTKVVDHLVHIKEILHSVKQKRVIVDRIMHESRFMTKRDKV